MRYITYMVNLLIIVLLLALGWTTYLFYQTQKLTQKQSQLLTAKVQESVKDSQLHDIPDVMQTTDTVTKKQLWTRVQQQFKDTVVQVFSQIAEFNWIEPYKTPNQMEATGSAFFINDSGQLITNAHVVEQAQAVSIQIPSLGKRRFDVTILGISPERDLALLEVKPAELEAIKKALGKDKLPYMLMGNSDHIHRADKIMALGYPLGQQGLKSTTGVVSGREHIQGQHFIQISAPLNKGNSGGPSLNSSGEVVGVNSAGIANAQNVGYIIPSNDVQLFLRQIRDLLPSQSPILLRKPYLGVIFTSASDSLTAYLKNPPPGGLYVVEVYKGSPLQKAGVQPGDMMYEINGHAIDMYGEMNVDWSLEDKISIIDYISRLKVGDDVRLVIYRKGVRKELTLTFAQTALAPIRVMYPGYEGIDYEVMAGLIVMQLTLNHVLYLVKAAPDLMQYADFKKQMEPLLVVTQVQLNSPAYRTRVITPGTIITHVNNELVKTLDDFRKAVLKSTDTGYLTLKTKDNGFVVLSLPDIIQDEERLAALYFYRLSSTYKDLKQKFEQQHAAQTVKV